MIKRIDHVAVVVDDLDAAVDFWHGLLKLDLDLVEDAPEQESRIAFLGAGDAEIELVKPTSDTSGVARFLGKRGPGLHHICLEVENLEAMMERLKAHGVQLLKDSPQVGSGGKKLAFIHPKSANGVLVELYELPQPASDRLGKVRQIADRMILEGQIMAAAVQGFSGALLRGSLRSAPIKVEIRSDSNDGQANG